MPGSVISKVQRASGVIIRSALLSRFTHFVASRVSRPIPLDSVLALAVYICFNELLIVRRTAILFYTHTTV